MRRHSLPSRIPSQTLQNKGARQRMSTRKGTNFQIIIAIMSNYMHASGRPMTLTEIIAHRKEKKTPQVKILTSVIPLFVPFTPPKKDEIVTNLTSADSIRQFISSIPGFEAMKPINSSTPGIQTPPSIKSAVVVNPLLMTWGTASVEGLASSQLDTDITISESFRTEVRKFTNAHYVGSGTIQALIRRIKGQITTTATLSATSAEWDYVKKSVTL